MGQDKGTDKGRDKLPPLNALRSFEAVARHGSFAGAATDLHVTHWAVGKQIRLLEDWFGLPLFERRARGVVLTDEGAALLNDVSNAFERLGTAAARLRHDGSTRRISGIVRVNVPASFALSWLVPRLADFQTRHPDVEVRVSTTSRKLRFIGDAFDIGVRSGAEGGAGVESRTLMADLRLPACSPALLRQHPYRTWRIHGITPCCIPPVRAQRGRTGSGKPVRPTCGLPGMESSTTYTSSLAPPWRGWV